MVVTAKDKLTQARLLECGECRERYSLQDVEQARYFPSTGVCLLCYQRLQARPHQVCCFGKKTLKLPGKPVKYGWDSQAVECRFECPDRNICRAFVLSLPKESEGANNGEGA